MSDQFFTPPDQDAPKPASTPDTPDQTPSAPTSNSATETDKPVDPPKSAVTSTPPPVEPLPTLAGPAEIARAAHQRQRRLISIIVGCLVIVAIIVIILIWRLNQPSAPTSSNITTNTNTNANTNTAKPTLNSQLPGSNSSSANTVGWQAVTTEYVRGATYPSPQSWTTVNKWNDVPIDFTLSNGVVNFDGGWYKVEDQKIDVHLTVFLKDEAIGTGDVDGDGLTDAVAILKWTDGGTGAFPVMYTIFGNQPNQPVENTDVIAGVIGGSYSATKVELSRDTLKLQLSYPQAGDASCCWTGQANLTFTLSGQQWRLAN